MSAYPRQRLAFAQALADTWAGALSTPRLFHRSQRLHLAVPASAAGVSGLAMIASVPEVSAAPLALIMMGVVMTLATGLRAAAPRSSRRTMSPETPRSLPANRDPQASLVDRSAAQTAPRALPRRLAPAASRQSGAAVADLMARVSHEIRTPLNAVIGFSDVMNAEMFGPVGHPRYREYVTHICDSGRALLKSAEDTLAITALLAERHSGQAVGVVDFSQIANEAWSSFAPEASARGVNLVLKAAGGLLILAEKRPLQQAFVNLLREALTRAGDMSCIEIGARIDGEHAEISVSVVGNLRPAQPGEVSLALSFAETLLELSGAFLIVDATETGWCVSTVLTCSAQTDFFDPAPIGPAPRAYVC